MSALPHFSDVDLLGYSKRIIDFDSQIPDPAAAGQAQGGLTRDVAQM